MENKVLNANLDEIRRYNPPLANEILRMEEIKSNLALVQNENGEYNLAFNSIPLHSSLGAIEEARKIATSVEDNKNAIRVIYGLGLGYLLDEFISAKNDTIIVYEPNLDILRATLEVVEFGENLKKENVFICSKKETLIELIGKISTKETKITVSFLNSYFKLFEKDIREVAKLIEMENGKKHTNNNTFKVLAPKSVPNTFCTLKNIEKAKLLSDTTFLNAPKTALIASAGPSLAENIEAIKKNRDKFTLICVGPAVKLLLDNGITPDFLCILEVGNTKGQVENLDLSNVNLIFEPFSASYLWDLNVKNKFLYFSKNNFLNDWCAKFLGLNISENISLGTVSYCALSCAKKMGHKKIILCGQDLAFRDGNCYAKGSVYEELECVLDKKTNKYIIRAKNFEKYAAKLTGENCEENPNAKIWAQGHIDNLNSTIYTVKGQNGEMLPTQAGYALFIKDFEEFAKTNGNKLELINSSIGGAQIEGYKNLELSKALEGEQNGTNIAFEAAQRNYDKEKIFEFLRTFKIIAEELHVIAQKFEELIEEEKKELSRRKAVTKNSEKLRHKRMELVREISSICQRNEVAYTLCAAVIKDVLERETTLNGTFEHKNYLDLLEKHYSDGKLLKKYITNLLSILVDV